MSLGLAKEFIPRSMAESQGQVQSYLASCHFSLQQYPKALEAGKEAYKIRPGRSLVCKCVFILNGACILRVRRSLISDL